MTETEKVMVLELFTTAGITKKNWRKHYKALNRTPKVNGRS